MKCPACRDLNNRVIDSRLGKDGDVIRRRRECEQCARRFTTYERVEDYLPSVVKKDGRRESYDRMKVLAGLKKACEKRPISVETIELTADLIERNLLEKGDKEVPSSVVGETIMTALHDLDSVAYVRFASVYRSFQDIDEFVDELEDLLKERRGTSRKRRKRSSAASAKPARTPQSES
ncbi:MAG: transcriptional regulator NrdR [Candidatus Binatia bacterium]|nr:transcriptional regulator NrdR [Candidatus Binatia bacterium]